MRGRGPTALRNGRTAGGPAGPVAALRDLCVLGWPCLGYAFMAAWSQVVFSDRLSSSVSSVAVATPVVHLFGSLSALVVALAAFALCGRMRSAVDHRMAMVVACLLCCLGTLGVAHAQSGALPGSSATALFAASVAAAGAASAWLTLFWYETLAAHGVRRALALLAVCTVVSSVAFFCLMACPARRAVVAVATGPLIVGAFGLAATSRRRRARTDAGEGALLRPDGRRAVAALLPLAAVVALAGIADGTLLNLSLVSSATSGSVSEALLRTCTHAGTSLAGIALALWAVKGRAKLSFCACSVLMSASAVVLLVWPDAPAEALTTLARAGIGGVQFLTVALAVRLAGGSQPLLLRLLALYLSADFAGKLLGQMASTFLAGNHVVTTAMLVADLVAMILIAFVTGFDEGTAGQGPAAGLDVAVEGLAREVGFSQRELEVARLWVAGHNSAFVEERLGISKHTVRTHLKAVYAKSGTANKEELIRLVEDRAKGGASR